MDRVRVDKWLWAARFFKTRSLAKTAIEGGKVRVNGQRPKVSKELVVGDTVDLRQGWDDRTVTVTALSDQRRGAPEAALLYRETDDSLDRRALRAAQRKQVAAGHPGQRPTKKQRRLIHRFKEQGFHD